MHSMVYQHEYFYRQWFQPENLVITHIKNLWMGDADDHREEQNKPDRRQRGGLNEYEKG